MRPCRISFVNVPSIRRFMPGLMLPKWPWGPEKTNVAKLTVQDCPKLTAITFRSRYEGGVPHPDPNQYTEIRLGCSNADRTKFAEVRARCYHGAVVLNYPHRFPGSREVREMECRVAVDLTYGRAMYLRCPDPAVGAGSALCTCLMATFGAGIATVWPTVPRQTRTAG